MALPEQRQSGWPSERVQDGLACDFASSSSRIFGSTICAPPMQPHFLLAASRTSGSTRNAQVFKKYSQMKLQMKREALQKLNRRQRTGQEF